LWGNLAPLTGTKFADSDSGFFFKNLLEDFQAAGTGSGIRVIHTIKFFCQLNPGIWIENAADVR